MDVLDKLRAMMDAQGISEYGLAKRSGVPQSTINSLFRNHYSPTIPTLEALAHALGVSIRDFFDDASSVQEPAAAWPKQLFDKYHELTPKQQDLIRRFIDELTSLNEHQTEK